MRALLSPFFIILIAVSLENVSPSVRLNLVKRLTTDGKYPVQDCENLQLPIQMQLSQKRKIFSIFGSISGIYIKFSTF